MTDEETDLYGFECPDCGHQWKASLKELTIVPRAIGKWVKCPKCEREHNIIRIGKPIKNDLTLEDL